MRRYLNPSTVLSAIQSAIQSATQSAILRAILAGLLAAPAAAQVYGNPTNGLDGWSIDVTPSVADDFRLLGPVTLTSVRYFALMVPTLTPSAFVSWNIRANVAGSPGTSIASGTAATTATYVGQFPAYGGYFKSYAMDFSLSVPLAAGIYWLGLTAPSASPVMYWETANVYTGSATAMINGVHSGTDFAFELSGEPSTVVPEPASLLLASFGFAFLAGIARRRTVAA